MQLFFYEQINDDDDDENSLFLLQLCGTYCHWPCMTHHWHWPDSSVHYWTQCYSAEITKLYHMTVSDVMTAVLIDLLTYDSGLWFVGILWHAVLQNWPFWECEGDTQQTLTRVTLHCHTCGTALSHVWHCTVTRVTLHCHTCDIALSHVIIH